MISAHRGNFMFGLSQQRIHLHRVAQKHGAGLSERDLRARTIEELNAKVFFKSLDLEAHRGLGKVQFLRSLAEAELLRNGAKDNQTEILETRHATIKAFSTGELPQSAQPIDDRCLKEDPVI